MDRQPLAELMRPRELEEVVGQREILGPGKVLPRLIESGQPGNLILYGPSGTGKTTLAHIIAKKTRRTFCKLNATTCTTADIKGVVDQVGTMMAPDGVLLYLDEIQYFNKKQQQTLLEHLENGKITLVASTTENPYFYVYGAILSRCNVFQFRPVEREEIARALERALDRLEQEQQLRVRAEEGVLDYVAGCSGGDVRKALNILEALIGSAEGGAEGHLLTMEAAQQLTSGSYMRYDREGDQHYDILSGLHKSIRGSDVDAGMHYAARLIAAGDLLSLCRRLLVIAAEDVGMAYPQAMPIVKSCVDSALQLGLPEGRIPLAQAVAVLATAPKSNSSYLAMDQALADVEAGLAGEVPDHLKDAHYSGASKLGRGLTYRYPHDYPNHYVEQEYLPESLRGRRYFTWGDSRTERAAREYWQRLRGEKEET
ncbi:MAG: replication-associated recombination protein A [Eubacteriales bacterium]